MLHSLPDGTRILLRPIEAADKDRLAAAHGRLSEETIRRRYLAAKPRFSAGELRYLTEVDGRNHLALAAFLAEDPETIVGVARCVRLLDARETAEFAIVVGDAFQGRGLGTLLARELATAARADGHPPLRRHHAQRQRRRPPPDATRSRPIWSWRRSTAACARSSSISPLNAFPGRYTGYSPRRCGRAKS